MRNYLRNIEIVGATMCYRERDLCRFSLDWLYANCDRVCILLDNWDKETEAIVLEYKEKHPGMTNLIYSTEPVNEKRNMISGQVKRRFKNRQAEIREQVCDELRRMHSQKPIDLLIWPDSDETFIDEFTNYLEDFWLNQPAHDFMMLGFLEVYDSFKIIITQPMSPHGRVYKYKPELTLHPWRGRTRYNPYYSEKRPWKVRNLVVHCCWLTEEFRAFREHTVHENMLNICAPRRAWLLPKDVRKMTTVEIADYQYGYRQAPPKYEPILLTDYINNKSKYLKEYPLWTKD